jgi:hypothetical protein
MAGLSDKLQAIAVFISVLLIGLGTAAETIPSTIPADNKALIFTIFWILGIIGLALKEALGTNTPVKSAAA